MLHVNVCWIIWRSRTGLIVWRTSSTTSTKVLGLAPIYFAARCVRSCCIQGVVASASFSVGDWAVSDFSFPCNLKSVHQRSPTAVKKAAVQRDLDSLVESGQVVEKTYGKQKIYYASQEHTNAPSDEDLAAIDKEIETLEEQVTVSRKPV